MAQKSRAQAVDDTLSLLSRWATPAMPSLTCSEAETFADLLRAYGRTDEADRFIERHAAGDESGDRHYVEPECPDCPDDAQCLTCGRMPAG